MRMITMNNFCSTITLAIVLALVSGKPAFAQKAPVGKIYIDPNLPSKNDEGIKCCTDHAVIFEPVV